MDSDVKEVLSAFVDGETVDIAELTSALAEPGAREALVDFVRLRLAFSDESRPSATFARQMRQRLGGETVPRMVRPLRLAAAAVIAVLALFGAFGLGRRLRLDQEEPPEPTRIIRFEPGIDWKSVPLGGPS